MIKLRFVLAVLLRNGRYVLQLRDNKPGIPDPGVWALFGGQIEEDEEPSAALIREVQEELGIQLSDYQFVSLIERRSDFFTATVQYWLFEADITHLWGQHRLAEGEDVKPFSFEELHEVPMPSFIRDILQGHNLGRHAKTSAQN